MRIMMRIVSAIAIAAGLAFPAAAALPDSFSDVVEPVMPAVVNISTTQKITRPGITAYENGVPVDPQSEQFRELFKQFQDFFGNQMQGMEREVTSLGSGFVIDASGYIVTNNHVIANAEDITVIFSDESRLKATLVGSDPKTDLALLKVKPEKKLTAVKFGDSDALKVGDWVIAVGNPFGLGGSVSAGIVSARGRNIHAGPFDDFIQTDAAINRGNSGGPLFNAKGEVVGINAAIFSPTGGNIGIGFAVPANMAKRIIGQLRDNGKVQRAWLGVKIQDVTDDIADAMGLGEARGAAVLEAEGPAAAAGIQAGDVIVTFNGEEVNRRNGLPKLVSEATIGDRAQVGVWRKGREVPVTVKLGELPGDPKLAALEEGEQVEEKSAAARREQAVLGMALAPITPQLRAQARLPQDAHGLLVTHLDPMGEAARRGLQPGDIVQEVNQQPVKSIGDLKGGLKNALKARRKFALFKIQRRNLLLYIALPVQAER